MIDNRRLFLILAGLNVLWAPVNLAIKTATSGGMSPAAVGLVRWSSLALLLFSALAFPSFRTLTRAKWPTRRDAFGAMGLGFVLFGPAHLIYYSALTLTSSVEGAVLGTTAPVWTALMAYIALREKVDAQRWGAIILGSLGAYVVSVGFAAPQLSSGNTGGNLLYLAGVLAESIASVLAAAYVRRSSGITILAFQVLGSLGALALGPLMFPTAIPITLSQVSVPAVLAVAYLIFLPGLVCFSVWYRLVETTPLSLMVLTILLQPPLSALIGWWALREKITLPLIVGTSVIIVALIVGSVERRKPQPKGA